MTDQEAEAGGAEANSDDTEQDDITDETVPQVNLELYQVSVHVSGRSDDDLDTVESTARRLMDYLIEQTHELEERPDDRGLG